jgi:catechol 2,3-dioxygenase-like lactoylglutathione lyase family enzyme
MAKIHHTAICPRDVEESLRFWRDGLGLQQMMDMPFEGDWPTLFGAPTSKLRSIFLGDPADFDSGILELVVFDGAEDAGPPAAGEPRMTPGFFLVSLSTDVDAVLGRLAELGVGGEPRAIEVGGVRLVTVSDPDGVQVELMDAKATSNLETINKPE